MIHYLLVVAALFITGCDNVSEKAADKEEDLPEKRDSRQLAEIPEAFQLHGSVGHPQKPGPSLATPTPQPQPLPNTASTSMFKRKRSGKQEIAPEDDNGHAKSADTHNLLRKKVTFAAEPFVKTFDNSLEPATIKATPVNQAKLSDGSSSAIPLRAILKIGENTNPVFMPEPVQNAANA